MQYALLCYETRDDFAAREDPSRSAAYWDGWMAYGSALRTAGVFVSGAGFLPPDTGTSVRSLTTSARSTMVLMRTPRNSSAAST